eukprot:403358060
MEELKQNGQRKRLSQLTEKNISQITSRIGITPRSGGGESPSQKPKMQFNSMMKYQNRQNQALENKKKINQTGGSDNFSPLSNVQKRSSNLITINDASVRRKSMVGRLVDAIRGKPRESTYFPQNDSSLNYLEQSIENESYDHPPLAQMSALERRSYLLVQWRRAFIMAHSCSRFLNVSQYVKRKIEIFGKDLSKGYKRPQEDGDQLEDRQKLTMFLVMPHSIFNLFWCIVQILLQIYTATYMPYKICFDDEVNSGGSLVFEYFLDLMFGIDVLVNFFTVRQNQDGTQMTNLNDISRVYLRSTFILDVLCSLPSQVLEVGYDQNEGQKLSVTTSSSLRMIAKLYKVIRLVKFIYIWRRFKKIRIIQVLKNKLKLSAAFFRMIFTLLTAFLSVHIVSCLWYLAAKYKNFSPETWVVRLNKQDQNPSRLYLECLFWSLQTVATVGYGNFGASTVPELLMSIIWMVFGVAFYSIIIGNLSLIIANESSSSQNLIDKMQSIDEFASKTHMPDDLTYKLKAFLEKNYEDLYSHLDDHIFLKELPQALKDEIFQHRFHHLIDAFELLKNCPSKDFIKDCLQVMKRIKVDKDDVIYNDGDLSEEIYFIKKGTVKIYTKNGMPFIDFTDGQQFGEAEVVLSKTRDGKAVALTDSVFYCLHKDDLEMILGDHPPMVLFFENLAEETSKSYVQKKEHVNKITPIFGRKIFKEVSNEINFLDKSKLNKFGLVNKKRFDSQTPLLPPQKRGLDKDLIIGNGDSTTKSAFSKGKKFNIFKDSKKQDFTKTQDPETNYQEEIKINLRKKSSGQFLTSDIDNIQDIDSDYVKIVKKSNLNKKKKERLDTVLSKIDQEPEFTRSVADLLQNEMVFQTNSNINTHQMETPKLKPRQDSSRIDSQGKIQELKTQFEKKNKVSSRQSYDLHTSQFADQLSQAYQQSQNFDKSQALISTEKGKDIKILEEEEGDDLAEEGLENLAQFNQDMNMIARNVFEIYNLFDILEKDNQYAIERMHQVESKTIELEELQAENLKTIEKLLNYDF